MLGFLKRWLGWDELDRLRGENEILRRGIDSNPALVAAGPLAAWANESAAANFACVQVWQLVAVPVMAFLAIEQWFAGQPLRRARRTQRSISGTKAADRRQAPTWVKMLKDNLEPVEHHELLAALNDPNSI